VSTEYGGVKYFAVLKKEVVVVKSEEKWSE
jgi:hypothetical protein